MGSSFSAWVDQGCIRNAKHYEGIVKRDIVVSQAEVFAALRCGVEVVGEFDQLTSFSVSATHSDGRVMSA